MDLLKDWWGVGAAVVAVIMAYAGFKSTTTSKIDSLERRMSKAEADIEMLERSGVDNAVTLGIIQTTLTQIKEGIDGLREEMRTKADK